MQCRNAELNDAKGIANVLVKSYNIKTLNEGVKTFKNELIKQYKYIIAIEQGKIAGIITWQIHGLPKHGLCELDRIAVLPECRGSGIAQALFKKLIENANKEYKKHKSKLRKLYILCHADNLRAHKFYKKMGMSHETKLKSHYYKGMDEFVFSRFF